MLVKDLAAWLESPWEGDGEACVRRAAALEDAGPEDLSFAANRKALQQAADSRAGCLLVAPDFLNGAGRTVIRTRDPRAAMAKAIAKMHPPAEAPPGIHASAVIAPDAAIGEGVSIGPLAAIGARVRIGAGTAIGAGTVIDDGVEIGERCVIHARVTIYRDVKIGRETTLHSGCVIGADGFGFVLADGAYEKFPQVGRVEIGDCVEIGANSCIDRASLGATTIGEGTKLDNLVHVGHNCKIGRHVVVAAQTGFAGGVVVGDHAVIGGQVGIGDLARIEAGAVLGSGSGVLTSKIVRAGEVMWGTPARPLKEYLAQLAALSRMAKKKKRSSGSTARFG